MVSSSNRSNVVPSLIILAGLSFGGSGHARTFQPPVLFPQVARIIRTEWGLSSETEWYSKHLQAAGEPSLWSLSRRDREATAFRFLWLPSFHHAVCVRIARKGNGAILRAIVLDGLGGYDPGQVAIDKSVELDERRWQAFERHLESAAFWTIPTKDPGESGSDGDQCIIEGVKSGVYHIVDRWEPDPAYTALCRSMLDLTGLKTQKTWAEYHHN